MILFSVKIVKNIKEYAKHLCILYQRIYSKHKAFPTFEKGKLLHCLSWPSILHPLFPSMDFLTKFYHYSTQCTCVCGKANKQTNT